MALGRYSKGASAQQGRYQLSKIFEDLFQSNVPNGNYGGYYDILIENGALDSANQPVAGQGSQVHKMTQLVTAASASDMVYLDTNSNPSWLEWRHDIVWETGNAVTDKPVIFYPESVFVQSDPETPLFLDVNQLRQAQLTFGVPPGVNVYEYTIAMLGARGLHKIMPDPLSRQTFLDQLGDAAGNATFPTSPEPGCTLIGIRYILDEPNNQFIIERRIFVDGVDQNTPPEIQSLLDEQGQPIPFDINVGAGLLDQFVPVLAMPCWALQKFLLVTRMVTVEEAEAITKRMIRTSRLNA